MIIDNKDNIWFNAKQVASALGYVDTKDALKRHVDKTDTKQRRNIDFDMKISGHPYNLYINEAGLYSIILSSKLKSAKKFKDWITKEILPSIRKYGYYKLAKKYNNEITELTDKLNKIISDNKRMSDELKKNKFPYGGIVYAIDYSTEKEQIYRIGMTGDMNKRKRIYDSHSLYKKDVIIIEQTKCPIRLETCIRSMLYKYRYKNNKDFYICDLNDLKKAFDICTKNLKCMDQKGGCLLIADMIDDLRNDIRILKRKVNYLNKKML